MRKYVRTGEPKGHWPAGKKRNAAAEEMPAIAAALKRLRRALRKPRRGLISRERVAAVIGVDARTVRRWLAAVDVPPCDMARRIVTWCEEVGR